MQLTLITIGISKLNLKRFDFVIIIASIFDLISEYGNVIEGGGAGTSIIKVLRIFRILRALKLVKTMKGL